jgi:hypothetical protein
LFEQRKAVLLYCSDVSGAFDRVSSDRLVRKLFISGMHPKLFKLLCHWLHGRKSCVNVRGKQSGWNTLSNQVYQGTVLGPTLWNIFFADIGTAVNRCGFVHTTFADDMNAWAAIEPNIEPSACETILLELQSHVHRYGEANQMRFDPSKETFHYLHSTTGFSFSEEQTFKILGCEFDARLLMHSAVRTIAVEAGWRLRSLFRSQRFFSSGKLMLLYKSLVLSYIESFTPAIYHTASSVIERIDRIQDRFLRRINLSQIDALLQYSLAPLPVRRDIAMLGILHKCGTRTAALEISKLFPSRPCAFPLPYPLRVGFHLTRVSHGRQLHTDCSRLSTDRFKRSIFGLVSFYNSLPEWVVYLSSISVFQRVIQKAIQRLSHHNDNWQIWLRSDWKNMSCDRFDATFSKADIQESRNRTEAADAFFDRESSDSE